MRISRITLPGAAFAIPVMVNTQSTPSWPWTLWRLVSRNESHGNTSSTAK